MPAQCELLLQESQKKLDVNWLLQFPFKLEKITPSIINLISENKLCQANMTQMPKIIHVLCALIHLLYIQVIKNKDTICLTEISEEFTPHNLLRLDPDRYNSLVVDFLFSSHQLEPTIARLNLTDEYRLIYRMIANTIGKTQLHDRALFSDMIEALRVIQICKEILDTRSLNTARRTVLFPPAPPSERKATAKVPQNKSSNEFELIDTPATPTVTTEEEDGWMLLGTKIAPR